MNDVQIVNRLKEYGITTVKIYGILEELRNRISNERCKRPKIDLDAFTFSCNKCNRNILQFCPACGSTKITHSRAFVDCSECGAILENRML